MNDKPSVYLKITTKHKFIIQRIHKYGKYLNSVFQKFEYPFYLEFFHNGFIIFTKSLQSFEQIYQYRTKLFNNLRNDGLNTRENIFLEDINLNSLFPAEGADLIIQTSGFPAKIAYSLLNKNYKLIHSEITIKQIDQSNLLLKFETPEAFTKYADFIQMYVYQLEKRDKSK